MKSLSLSQRLSLEIYRSLVDKFTKLHPLNQLFWECTLRCNLHCLHCGSDCKVQSDVKDMPLDDFLSVLDTIALHTDPHKVFVIISGGEPLMRQDLEKCGREIYSRGFPWGMVSNGYALTEERFSSLRSSGLHSITISLDGLEDSHDWMRGRQGSWKRAVEAITIIAKSGITHDVVTCVNSRNLDELDGVKDLLVSLGVKGWRLFTIFPQGRARDNAQMKIDGRQLVMLMEFIKRTRKEGKIACSFACEGFLGSYEGVVRDNFFCCNAGLSVASVLADGSISACASIRSDYYQGNIYRDDFWKVWEEKFQEYRNRDWMKKGECAQCKYFRYCKGNGMHLRDDNGNLMQCLFKQMENV